MSGTTAFHRFLNRLESILIRFFLLFSVELELVLELVIDGKSVLTLNTFPKLLASFA